MWRAAVVILALIAFANAQDASKCSKNEIYTSSCSYCEESCWPRTIKCGADLNPGCTSGQARCICPAGYDVARSACGGCRERSICPFNQPCFGFNCAEDEICEVQQICIRASPMNYDVCIPNSTISTTPTTTEFATTAPDPCEGFFCPCGEICANLWNGPECVDFGACGRGLHNCTFNQLCNDTGLSRGCAPNCYYGWTCTDLPPETTIAPLPTSTRSCKPGERFFITFLNNRAGQCLPEDTIANPCKYLRCKSGYSCVSQPVAECPCCGQNARCLATNTTGIPHATTPMTTPAPTTKKAKKPKKEKKAKD